MANSVMNFLKECVLDAAADDIENLTSMASNIEKWAAEAGHQFTRADLVDAIEQLAREGKLNVYVYSVSNNTYETTAFTRPKVDDLWFSSR